MPSRNPEPTLRGFSRPAEPQPSAEPAPARVLIVDDSSTQLAFAAATLREAGWQVEVSDNVWIASVIGDFRPDIVLVDVNLAGGCSGPTLIRAFKKRSLASGARFILYSTAPAAELHKLAESCEADGWIHKDGDGERLV